MAGARRGGSLTPGRYGYSSVDELIEQRKADHLRLSAGGDVDARAGAGWDDIHLVHEALPEVVQHGAIAKAGLPKNFRSVPMAQAAE